MCLSCFANVDKARVNFGESIVDSLDMLKLKLGMCPTLHVGTQYENNIGTNKSYLSFFPSS